MKECIRCKLAIVSDNNIFLVLLSSFWFYLILDNEERFAEVFLLKLLHILQFSEEMFYEGLLL